MGEILNFFKKHTKSAHCYLKALDLSIGDSYLLGQYHHQMMLACDWSNYQQCNAKLFKLTNEGRKGGEPFGYQGIASSEQLLKKCAEIYSNDKFPTLGNLSKSSKYKHNKIRIGYLCGEFREQATSILMTRVWELHDKSKFEIFAFDNGWDDGSDYRQRIEEAFSKKINDISRLSDMDSAKLIRKKEIDILVNLNGYFGRPRQGVFSYKPAPIQVNYLGFPGTIGAQYMDYIIADKIVLPHESKKYYVEKVVHLPNSYQANDNQRIISKRKFTKTELGLPENGFIFACFNNNYKITPPTLDSWIRILTHVPGSVLWLLADNPGATENLVKTTTDRGIDSCRLVFAERLSISEHLARHDLADLFLDTLPYNAHTTCSDALWTGLPVVTLVGNTFPGRVAASLLNALGLGELVCYSYAEYESMAIDLATKPEKLDVIKKKLAQNRLTTPLFNTPVFTKNLECSFNKMYERYQNNLEPDHISVI
jgi:predicted O-linked N-acetylglucosamine transferase (SPINDLY family)